MTNYKKMLSMLCALSVLCSNSASVVSALAESEPLEAHAEAEKTLNAAEGDKTASESRVGSSDAAVESLESASDVETVAVDSAAVVDEDDAEIANDTQFGDILNAQDTFDIEEEPAEVDGDIEEKPVDTEEDRDDVEPSSATEEIADVDAEPTSDADDEETAAVEPLNVVAIALKRSGFVGWEIEFSAPITGGVAPYAVHYAIEANGSVVYTADEQVDVVRYYPTALGLHTLTVTVTDAEGSVATAKVSMHVAIREQENPRIWTRTLPKLEEGLNYAERLLAIAESQVGYKESNRDFIVDKNGAIQGYTRYGDWWGLEYEEWCAMFVSFCLNYAEIPWKAIPEESNCNRWRNALGSRYINIIADEENADYEPQPGDLIFFRTDDTVEEKDFPTHIGIVTGTSEHYIYTIEGNSAASVREREYKRDDERIVGYVSIVEAMEKYDENYNAVENSVAFEIDDGLRVTARDAAVSAEEPGVARNGRLVFAVDVLDGYILDSVTLNGEDVPHFARGKQNEYLITGVEDDASVVNITAHLDLEALSGIHFGLNVLDTEGNAVGGDMEREVGKGTFVLDAPDAPPMTFEGYAYCRATIDGQEIDALSYETVDGVGMWYYTVDGSRFLVGKDAELDLIYAAEAGADAVADETDEAGGAAYVEVLLDEIEAPDDDNPADTAENAEALREDAEPVNDLENTAVTPEEGADAAEAEPVFAPVRTVRIFLNVVDEKGKSLTDYRGKRIGAGTYCFNDADNPPLDIPGYVYQQAWLDGAAIDTLECVDGEWVAVMGSIKLIVTEDAALTLRYKAVAAPKDEKAEAPEDVRLTLKVLDINGTTLADYTGRRVGKGRFKLDDADSAPMRIEGRTYVRAMLDGRIIDTLEYNKEDGVWYATAGAETFAVTHSATLVLFYR